MLFGGGEPGTPDGLGGSAECPAEVFGVCSELVAGGYDPLELGAGGVRTLLAAFPGHYRLPEAGLTVVVAVPGCLLGLAHPTAALFLRHTLTRSRSGLFGYPRWYPGRGSPPCWDGNWQAAEAVWRGSDAVEATPGHTEATPPADQGFRGEGVATLSAYRGSGVARCGPVWHYAVPHGYQHCEHRSRPRRVLHVGSVARRCFLLRRRRRPQRSLGFGRRVEHDRRDAGNSGHA